MLCLLLFAILLLLPSSPLFHAFYRTGALVFGGGHVVLPLLRDAVVVPGFVAQAPFLAGYGAAQALPGPLFTFAAYLGAVAAGPHGAALALVAIFLPGLLLMAGTLPFWAELRAQPHARAAINGVNAAVVGLLAAALYSPLGTASIHGVADAVIAVALLLVLMRARPIVVVALGAAAGWLLG